MKGSGMTVRLNPAELAARLNARWKRGLPALAAQVLEDCNVYARDHTGALIQSSRGASDLKAGRLVWRTPYARRVYYKGTPSRLHNPAASLRWCERARTARLPAWQARAVRILGGDDG